MLAPAAINPLIVLYLSTSSSGNFLQLYSLPSLLPKGVQPDGWKSTCILTTSLNLTAIDLISSHFWRPYNIRDGNAPLPPFLMSRQHSPASLFALQKWTKGSENSGAIFLPDCVRELKGLRWPDWCPDVNLTYSICGPWVIAIWSTAGKGLMIHQIDTRPCVSGEVDSTKTRTLVPLKSNISLLAVSPWSGSVFYRMQNDPERHIIMLKYA